MDGMELFDVTTGCWNLGPGWEYGTASTAKVPAAHWKARLKRPYWLRTFMRVRYLLAFAAAIPAIVQIIRWLAATIGALARGPGSRCPGCLSKRTRRSQPRTSDTFFPAFLRPYRCENCKIRFFALHSVNYVRRARPSRVSRAMVPAAAQSSSRR
jgi:hypothetical protein